MLRRYTLLVFGLVAPPLGFGLSVAPPHSGFHMKGRARGFEGWYTRLTLPDADFAFIYSVFDGADKARCVFDCRLGEQLSAHHDLVSCPQLSSRRGHADYWAWDALHALGAGIRWLLGR